MSMRGKNRIKYGAKVKKTKKTLKGKGVTHKFLNYIIRDLSLTSLNLKCIETRLGYNEHSVIASKLNT